MSKVERYARALSKTLGVRPRETQTILEGLKAHVDGGKYSLDSMANHLNKGLNEVYQERHKIELEKAIRSSENMYATNNKDLIIGLYCDNKEGKGLGYKSIHKFLLGICASDEERGQVISSSTIRRYLHEKWEVPKNKNRHIPEQAIRKRQE